MAVNLPAFERAWIVEAFEFVLVAREDNREAAVRSAGEMVVDDGDAVAAVCDVGVQRVVCVAGTHACGCRCVDEVTRHHWRKGRRSDRSRLCTGWATCGQFARSERA